MSNKDLIASYKDMEKAMGDESAKAVSKFVLTQFEDTEKRFDAVEKKLDRLENLILTSWITIIAAVIAAIVSIIFIHK